MKPVKSRKKFVLFVFTLSKWMKPLDYYLERKKKQAQLVLMDHISHDETDVSIYSSCFVWKIKLETENRKIFSSFSIVNFTNLTSVPHEHHKHKKTWVHIKKDGLQS